MGVDLVLAESVRKRTLDNITVVMIAFSNFKRALSKHTQEIGPIATIVPQPHRLRQADLVTEAG